MAKLTVALSPFFAEGFWLDEVSGINFEKGKGTSIYPYDISNEVKLDGIRKALRLNVLLLIDGELGEQEIPKPIEKPKEEVKEEVKEEPKEEVKAPIESKGTKKVTK